MELKRGKFTLNVEGEILKKRYNTLRSARRAAKNLLDNHPEVLYIGIVEVTSEGVTEVEWML